MGLTNVRHDPHLGLGQCAQSGNLAGVVHPDLRARDLVGRIEVGQSQGQPDVVVEARLTLQSREPGRQARGGHLLDGRFAVAAGDGHQRHRVAGPIECGQRMQGLKGIVNQNEGRHVPTAGPPIVVAQPLQRRSLVHHGPSRPSRKGLAQEGVTVMVLAPEGDKELAGLQGPGVNGDPNCLALGLTTEQASARSLL